MKNKKIIRLGLIFIISFWTYTGLSFAQNSLIAQETPLFQQISTKGQGQTKAALVTNLPNLTINELTASIIKLLLSICGSLALISFTVGGITMITAQGDETKISKGKTILIWSIAGLAIIAVSYGVVVGVSQLEFFGGSPSAQTDTQQQTSPPELDENRGSIKEIKGFDTPAPGSEDLKPGEYGGPAI